MIMVWIPSKFGRPRDPRLGIGDLAGRPHAAQARRDRYVLPAVHRIGHGRRVDARADIDLPQHIERLVVEGDDRAVDQPVTARPPAVESTPAELG
jgi:hypothetical protein